MTKWPEGVDRLVFDSIDSTNAEASRRVAAGLLTPLWIFAGEQTRGVGRRGRPWVSPKGNFSASLVLPLNSSLQQAALRSFVAANALFDASNDFLGEQGGLTLKWPNDVLYRDRKLAGILLETLGAGPSHLCIGFGVNLNATPPVDRIEADAVPPVMLADSSDNPIDPHAFLLHLAHHFDIWNARFDTYGFEPVRRTWLSRAARLGQVIRARTGQQTQIGTFETVDESGALVLQNAGGRALITAADIFFEETGG